MKVLFTHSYFLRFDEKQFNQRKPYPPLATIQVAANLRKQGHDVSLFDTNFAHTPEEITKYFDSVKPDMLVIYDDGFNYLTKMCLTKMREAAFKMTQLATIREIPAFISSSDSTDRFEQYLENGASAVLLGEADETLKEICDQLSKNTLDLSQINGIAYKNKEAITENVKRPVLTDLDSLPLPAWDLIDIIPYQKAWSIHGYFSINLATTRGCPFKCNWCAKPIYGNRYNSRSPEHVVEEIKLIQNLFQFDHIWFCDDIFGLKPQWVQKFDKVLKNEKIKIRYKIQSRADLLLKDDTVKCLADSGCEEVWIGAESGSQRILDAMDKGTSIAQIEKCTHLMKQFGVKPCFFLQFGYLSETWEDVKATVNMLLQLMPFDIGISVSYPLPGTKFYETVKSDFNHKTNWTDSDDLTLMYNGTYSSKFYKKLHRFVHKQFRAAQAYLRVKNGKLSSIFKWAYFKSFATLYYFQLLYLKKIS